MGGQGPGLSHLSPLLSLFPCRAFVACARPGPAHSHDWKQREQARLPAGPSRQRFSQQTFQSESGLPFPHCRKTWWWTSPTSVPFPSGSTVTFLPCLCADSGLQPTPHAVLFLLILLLLGLPSTRLLITKLPLLGVWETAGSSSPFWRLGSQEQRCG